MPCPKRKKRMTVAEARKIAYAKIGTFSEAKRKRALALLRRNFRRKFLKK